MTEVNGFRSRIQSFVGQVSGNFQDGPKSSLFTTEGKMSGLFQSFVDLLPDAKPSLTAILNDDKPTADSVFEGIKSKMFDKKPSREELVDRLRERYSTTSISFEADKFKNRNTSDDGMNQFHRQQRRKQLMNGCCSSTEDNAFYSSSTSDPGLLDKKSGQQISGSGSYEGKAMDKRQAFAANLIQNSSYPKERAQTMYSAVRSPYVNKYLKMSDRTKEEVEGYPEYGKLALKNKMENKQSSNLGTPEKSSSALTVSSFNSIVRDDVDKEPKKSPRRQNVGVSDTKSNKGLSPKTVMQDESCSKEKDETKELLNECSKRSSSQNLSSEIISNNTYTATINFSVQYLIITKRLKISFSCINNICFPKSNDKAKRYILEVSLKGRRQKYTKSIKLMNGKPNTLHKDVYFHNLELCAAHMTSVVIRLFKRRKILPRGRYPVNGCITDLENLDIVGKVEVSHDMTEC